MLLLDSSRCLSDRTMFLLEGEIVEIDATDVIYSGDSKSEKTRGYVSGMFG